MFRKTSLLVFVIATIAFADCWWNQFPGAGIGVAAGTPHQDADQKKPDPENEEPVNLSTGAFTYQRRDLFIPGHVPLEITRNYYSRRYYNAPYGYGWTINYDMRITEFEDNAILLREQDGTRHLFTYDNGQYIPPAGLNAYLYKNPTNYIYQEKYGTQYIFDTLGYLRTIMDRNGSTLTLNYTAQPESIMGVFPYREFFGVVARRYLITQIEDDFGRTLNFYYDDNNRIDYIIGPNNYKIDYTINDQGDLISVTEDALGIARTTEYTYNANHCLTNITNPANEEYLTNQYDNQNRVTYQLYGSREFFIEYDDSVTISTDPMGNITTYAFTDTVKLLKWSINHYSDTTRYDFSGNYDLTQIIDPRGNATNFNYYFGNLLTIADALNDTTHLRYTSNFNLIDSIADPLGHTTKFRYDAQGNLMKIINALNKETNLEYDTRGNLLKITDPDSHVINYSYLVSNGLPHNSNLYGSVTYDSLYPTKIWAIVDGRIIAIKFDYDYRRGLRVAVGDPNDNITYYDYDSSNRLFKVYNSDNPPNTRHTNTPSMEYTYDIKGNMIKKQDYYGKFTEFEYDTLDQLREVWEHLGDSAFTTKYAYDLNGNLTTFENSLNQKTFYEYDALSRLIKVIYPDTTPNNPADNPFYTYLYNNPSDPINLYQRIDANGNITKYFYDALNRLDSLSYPNNKFVAYNYNDDYTLTSMKDSTGITSFSYNTNHQLTAVSYPLNHNLALSYYNNGLRKEENLDNNSHHLLYEYDALNRLKKVHDYINNNDILYTYDYNPATSYYSLGNLVKIAYPNNATTEYEYLECCSRIGSIVTRNSSSQVIESFEYEYDLSGNRTSTSLMDGSDIRYQYDDLNRLTAAGKRLGGNWVWTRRYSYDRVGNIQQLIWSQGGGSGTLNYSYYSGTNLLKTALNKTYTYDRNGNPITCSDGRQFQYDFENRLVRLTNGSSQTDFAYNGFGDRVAKIYNVFHQEKEIEYQKSVDEILGLTRNYNDLPLSRSVTSHQYVYDDLGRQIYEKQTVDSRQTLAYYTYGFGMQARRVNQTNNYLHSDILGSISAITNSSGSALGTYEYDPYGILLNSSTNLGNFAFTGQEIDFETNLYHFPARYYEPYWGRFLTADPSRSYYLNNISYAHINAIKGSRLKNNIQLSQNNFYNDPQTMHRYLYARNNPLLYIDPTGLRPCMISTEGFSIIGAAPYGGYYEKGDMEVIYEDTWEKHTLQYECVGVSLGLELQIGGIGDLLGSLLGIFGGFHEGYGAYDCPNCPYDLASWNIQTSGGISAFVGIGATSPKTGDLRGESWTRSLPSFGVYYAVSYCWTTYVGPWPPLE